MKQGQFPAVFNLTDLNGQNGFKLDGENNNDYSGGSVSAAGGINGDGYADLLIGAPYYSAGSDKGRSYVVFGGPGVGGSGDILLSSLNGTHGFKLDGENNNDGSSVSAAGDINGDGNNDLLIGARGYPSGSYKGRSYVVFGGLGIGSSGDILLSSLNGVNGFKLDGENNQDYSGNSLSAAGDINGDGNNDLLIGASGYPSGSYKGRSYVVFGGPGVGGSGDILLSSLNGTNGFKLDGENNDDESGSSVSAVGDINGDGIGDLLIGAYSYPAIAAKGRTYVVFGGLGVGGSGDISLANLNGANGFKLDGENNGDWSGYSVSSTGDINGDGYVDLLIGAPHWNVTKGRSYVVFGGPGVGSSGNISLSSLNGTNGFKLDGENNGEESGCSVRVTQDINGDGYDDLLIGAYGYPTWGNYKGRIYVVFGGPEVGSSGDILLSSLNGTNGFKLDGENNGDYSGSSVSAAGDINGDGIADILIGAYGYPKGNNTGRSYVIFGDVPPVLVNNTLNIYIGEALQLTSKSLAAYDHNHNNTTLVFIPSNISHGYFSTLSAPTTPLVNFTQSQITNGSIQFVHDGSAFAPSYEITVRSTGIAWTGPVAANITFLNSTPSPTPASTTPVPTSTPSSTVVSTPTSTPTPTPTSIPTISPIILQNNELTLSDGQTVVLTSNNLQAMESGFNNSQLLFMVSNVQNGYFSTTPGGNGARQNLTAFTQGQIQSGGVEFVHNGDHQAPGYGVLVTDGRQFTQPSSANIIFTDAPIVHQITLNVTLGETITLTPALLNITATDGSQPNQVTITLGNLTHAVVTSTVTGGPVTDFTLTDLEAGDIQLTQDGGSVTPSLTVTAEGVKQISSAPQQVLVYFSNQSVYAPQLVHNFLRVTQGKATVLSNQYLSGQEPPDGQALGNETMFFVSHIEYGHFSLINEPQTWITSFNQQQLLTSQVQFVQDGSASTPSYKAAVQAFGLQSASLSANIFFTPVNIPAPTFGGDDSSTIQKAIISAVISGAFGILFAVVQACLKRAANRKLLQTLGDSKEDYDMSVVTPVAREIARQIKITGFMNHTTNTKMAHFKGAVRTILFELTKRGVDLNFRAMNPAVRDGVINEITRQTRRIVLGDPGCCQGFVSFFKAQATPKAIEDAASEIAAAVAAAIQSLPVTVHRDSPLARSVELPSLSDAKEILLMANRSSSQVVLPDSPIQVDAPQEQQMLGT